MPANELNCNEWVTKYADYLYSYAYYKVGKTEEAEDLVQETFLSAYKGRETYNGTASEKTWLLAILKNKIIDFYRKRKNTDSLTNYISDTEELFERSFFDKEDHKRWKEEIEENYFSRAADGYLMSKEFQRFLSMCLDKMPPKLKMIFVAKYMDDEKTENICKVHSLTRSNYWVIIFRSKILLRTCLEKKGVLN